MDIKLVKNFEEGIYIPVNKSLLLQIIDDNYQMAKFNGKQMFMLNPVTNERFEVMPGIKKYDMATISYASVERDYIVFTSAERLNESEAKVIFYRYTLNDGKATVIYSVIMDLEQLNYATYLNIFVLDENFCIYETVKYHRGNTPGNPFASKGVGNYELILHDIHNNQDMKLENSVIARSGIENIIPLGGNMCVIKIGRSLIEEKMYDDFKGDSDYAEIIGIINVKQFISDLALNPDNVYIDELDHGSGNITFPYIRQYVNDIVYSKVDVEKKMEEVIIYSYDSKVKKVRMNSNITRISDLSHTYIINDVPYVLKNMDKSTKLINLNTQKTEMKLGTDVTIKYIKNDLIVTERHVKKMFFMRKENNYIEVFRFPDMHHSIFKTRAKYKDCIVHFEDLLIFTN
jgi:hypothetical protein